MRDDNKTAVLDSLQDRSGGGEARIDHRLDELTGRVGRLKRSVADFHVQSTEHSIRMDPISSRLERIERRPDLAEVGP